MQLIALMGLVSIEKMNLAVELAAKLSREGQSIAVIDNGARLALDAELLATETLIRLKGDLQHYLLDTLEHIEADTAILLVSEAAPLEEIVLLLHDAADRCAIDLHIVGLADLRTCDCFPYLRKQLDDYADVSFLAPFDARLVWETLG